MPPFIVPLSLIGTVGFEDKEYRTREGSGSVEVCVVVNGFGFTFSIATNDFTALGKIVSL